MPLSVIAGSRLFGVEFPEALTALAQLCASLDENETATYEPATQHGFSEAQLEWQSIGFHDVARKALLLFKKEANESGLEDWGMGRLSLTAETWTAHPIGSALSRVGHVYGAAGIHQATGDAYWTPGQGNEPDLWKWTRATNTWAQQVANLYTVANSRPSGGLAVHPNLYGSGNAGVVDYDRTGQLGIYRIDTDTHEVIDTDELPGGTSGIGVYWPAEDAIIVGVSQHLRIRPNGGATPLWDIAAAPPIDTRGTTSASIPNFGAMLVHPRTPTKLMILQRGGSRTVWTRTGGSAWTDAGYTHPITDEVSQASIWFSLGDDMGCLLNVRQNGATGTATVWRLPT